MKKRKKEKHIICLSSTMNSSTPPPAKPRWTIRCWKESRPFLNRNDSLLWWRWLTRRSVRWSNFAKPVNTTIWLKYLTIRATRFRWWLLISRLVPIATKPSKRCVSCFCLPRINGCFWPWEVRLWKGAWSGGGKKSTGAGRKRSANAPLFLQKNWKPGCKQSSLTKQKRVLRHAFLFYGRRDHCRIPWAKKWFDFC